MGSGSLDVGFGRTLGLGFGFSGAARQLILRSSGTRQRFGVPVKFAFRVVVRVYSTN